MKASHISPSTSITPSIQGPTSGVSAHILLHACGFPGNHRPYAFKSCLVSAPLSLWASSSVIIVRHRRAMWRSTTIAHYTPYSSFTTPLRYLGLRIPSLQQCSNFSFQLCKPIDLIFLASHQCLY